MIKIVFIDIDGTLLDSWGKISKNNIKACLNVQKQNIPVVINTGRYGTNALKIAEMIKVNHYQGYVIGNDGAEIWSFKKQQWIYLSQLNIKTMIKLAKWLLSYHDDLLLNFSSLNNMYVNRLHIKWGKWLEHLDVSIIEISDFSEIKENISKIMIILERYWNIEQIKRFISEFEEKFPTLTITQYHTNVFSIGNKNINKGTALIWLAKYLNINVKDALAIGDNFNDLAMFEVVGHPVVMDNAHEAIKIYGEWIAPNNDSHGVSKTLDYYILKKVK